MFEGHKHRCECHYPDSVCEVDDADCLQAQQAVSVHIPTKQNEQCRCKMDLCLMPYNFEPKCVGEEFAAGY